MICGEPPEWVARGAVRSATSLRLTGVVNANFDRITMRSTPTALAATVALALTQPVSAETSDATCRATSAVQQALVVELYTSEGCNSCPPADRWLSSLKSRPGVVAAAFHVDYWNSLGWVDRFGSARYTERQAEQLRSAGAGFSYTPQVLVNGRDWRGAPGLPAALGPALVQIELRRDPDRQVAVRVVPSVGAPARLALWWALLEDDHVTVVKAGENQGVTLHHDQVVRQYARLPEWRVASGSVAGQPGAAHELRLDPMVSRNAEGGHKARLLVVVTDAITGLPLQAAQLNC